MTPVNAPPATYDIHNVFSTSQPVGFALGGLCVVELAVAAAVGISTLAMLPSHFEAGILMT